SSATMRPRGSRCCRSSAARARPRGRSSSTRSRSSPSRCSRSRGASSGSRTRSPPRRSGRASCGWCSPSAATRRGAAPASSSTTRFSTWPCSSSPSASTRCSDDRAAPAAADPEHVVPARGGRRRARPQERRARPRPLRPLPARLRRDDRRRAALPRARLSELEGIFLARPETPPPGIPLAVKDLFDTAGLTTTYGSILFADHVPDRTAEAVSRLEAAGYGVVGKTNLHEFAYGVTSENPHFGTVPNPVAPGRIAGGSSGGSAAALAAGLADAALGTDSGGSIRIPAACCGVVGFKPTYGLVSIDGCFPLAPSFDHAGPMARSVEACSAMLQLLAPGLEPVTLDSLEEVAAGVAWIDAAE